MYSAASMLVLPGTAVVPIRSRCFNRCRAFSDKTLTLTRAAAVQPPKLMVFSRENPRSCSFFDLSRSINKDGIDQTSLNFDREVEMPEAAASDRTLCVGSSEGIVFVHNPTQLLAFDPLTATPFPLPPNSTLDICPQAEGSYDECRFVEGKIILSPSRDMLVRLRRMTFDVARPGDDGWTRLKRYDIAHDFIFHKGLLYGLTFHGHVIIYGGFENGSLPEPNLTVYKDFVLERKSRQYFFYNFLVESPDGKELFLVYRQNRIEDTSTEYFKIFKLNEEGKWRKVRKIGDMAIFVGINQSVSVRASDFPHILKPNSIYFTESHHVSCHAMIFCPQLVPGIRGVGLYSLVNRSIQFFELTKSQEVVNWPDWPWPPAVWYIPPITS